MKKLRFMALLLVALMACTALAGCNTSAPAATAQPTVAATAQPTEAPTAEPTPTPQEKVTLKLGWWGNDTRHAATLAAVDFWNKNNPNIQIETSPQGWDGYEDKLLTEFTAGTAPDIFQIPFTSIANFAVKGQLYDLTPYVATSFTGYDDILKSLYAVDGKNYALSTGVNVPCLLYNKTILDRMGIAAPSDSETWESLLERCKAVTKDTNNDGKIDIWGMDNPAGMPFEFIQQLAVQYGLTLFSEDGKLSKYDDPNIVAMYKALSAYMDAGVCPAPGEITVKEGSDSLLSGYTVYGISTLSAYSGSASSSPDEIDCAAFPVVTGKDEARYVAGAVPMAIYSKTAHPDQAVQFLAWFLTSSDSAKAQGGMVRGVFPSKAQRDALADKASTDRILAQGLRVADYFSTLKTSGSQPASPANLSEWEKVLQDAIDEYSYKKITIEQFCQKVKELGDPILGQ